MGRGAARYGAPFGEWLGRSCAAVSASRCLGLAWVAGMDSEGRPALDFTKGHTAPRRVLWRISEDGGCGSAPLARRAEGARGDVVCRSDCVVVVPSVGPCRVFRRVWLDFPRQRVHTG